MERGREDDKYADLDGIGAMDQKILLGWRGNQTVCSPFLARIFSLSICDFSIQKLPD